MKLHFHAEKNWLNDPNGLVQLHGWYHLFYQYNPHGLEWGDIHWGHARSRDLYRWEHLPVAMAPDAARGELHCFSGSCCKDADGQPHFYYTSIGSEADGRSHVDGAQQWMAEPTDDTLTVLKQTDAYALKADMHGSLTVKDWRDPCVVPYGDGYIMVLGGCADHRGCVLLYTSDDMKHWTYRHVLAQGETADDVPWECPNLCFVDGKAVIFYSPCREVAYQVGTLDEALCFHKEKQGLLDPAGRDAFYAPQVLRDEAGRAILMGWMPECDGGADAARRGWNGCMAMPRLLSIRHGNLYAALLDGWQAWCEPCRSYALHAGEAMQEKAGQHYVLQTALKAGETMTIAVLATPEGADLAEETCITMTAGAAHVCAAIDRTRSSQLKEASVRPLAVQAALEHGLAEVTLVVEENTVELCVNGRWLSARVYPGRQAEELRIACTGNREVRLFIMR